MSTIHPTGRDYRAALLRPHSSGVLARVAVRCGQCTLTTTSCSVDCPPGNGCGDVRALTRGRPEFEAWAQSGYQAGGVPTLTCRSHHPGNGRLLVPVVVGSCWSRGHGLGTRRRSVVGQGRGTGSVLVKVPMACPWTVAAVGVEGATAWRAVTEVANVMDDHFGTVWRRPFLCPTSERCPTGQRNGGLGFLHELGSRGE